MNHPGASIGSLCERILEGAVPDAHDLESLLRAGDEAPLRVRRRPRAARAPLRRRRLPLRVRVLLDLLPQRVRLLLLPRAATTRARATARPRTRWSPSAATSPAPASSCSTSRWARTPPSTTSPATPRSSSSSPRSRTAPGCRSWCRPASCRRPRWARLSAAGADWYALLPGDAHAALYDRLRVGQPFEARAAARGAARRAGLLVEDGLLTGIGDTAADRARSVVAMREAGWEQVRVMTFVPQAGTPLAGRAPGRATRTSCSPSPRCGWPCPTASSPPRWTSTASPAWSDASRPAPTWSRRSCRRRSGSPASRRPSSTSTRATAPSPACCRTSRGSGCAGGRRRVSRTDGGGPRRFPAVSRCAS